MNTGTATKTMQQSPSTRGFSLVEVLIAVLVLAIGMLGLGAVFPAIIAEQRSSFEVIEGENAVGAAAALLSDREFVDFELLDPSFNKPFDDPNQQYTYDWVVPQFGANFYGWTTPVPAYYSDDGSRQSQDFTGSESGTWSFNANRTTGTANTYPQYTEIPVRARLYPQPYSGKTPRFVWDVSLRREPSGDRLQAAIFVRRIDARVRVPKNQSLDDVLTGGGGISFDDVRLPVALSPFGQPTADNGSGQVYAAIQMLEVEVYQEQLDWLVFKTGPAFDTSVGFAVKPGQKLVDNTGVVRTVVGPAPRNASDGLSLPNDRRAVIVDPPFAPQNAGGNSTDQIRPDQNTSVSNGLMNERSKRASWVRQVIFTPRTPVAVRVITLGGDS